MAKAISHRSAKLLQSLAESRRNAWEKIRLPALPNKNFRFLRQHLLRFSLVVAITSLVVSDKNLSAQEPQSSPFAFLARQCLTSGPNFRTTEANARASGWPSLSEKVLQALTPIMDPVALKGWIVSDESEPLKVILISKGLSGTRTVEGCTVGFYGIDTEVFQRTLETVAGAGKGGTDDNADRVIKVYLTTSDTGREEFVMLSLPRTVNGPDQLIATVLSELP